MPHASCRRAFPAFSNLALALGVCSAFTLFEIRCSRSRAAAAAQPIQKTQKLPSRGPVRANGVLQ